MKTKKEKLKQNNLSSKKKTKNWVANQNNERNKIFRDWSRKKTFCRKNFFAQQKFYQRSKKFIIVAKKTFLPSKNFISVAKKKSVE